MRAIIQHSLFFALCAAAVVGVRADVVVLAGGESMSGSLVRIEEFTLVFRTTLQGQLMVPMDTIEGLTTSNNYVVTLTNDRVYYAKFQSSDGKNVLTPLDGGDPLPVTFAEVLEASLIPPTPQRAEEVVGEGPATSGRAGVGMLGRSGTEGTVGPVLRMQAERSSPAGILEGSLSVEPGDEVDWLEARAGYRFDTAMSFDPLLEVGVERNLQEHLQLRSGLLFGMLYPAIDAETASLDAVLGLEVEHEDREGTRGDEINLNLRLGLRYESLWLRESTFTSELALLPGLDDFGEFRARSQSALAFPLSQRLRLRLDLLLDYDSQPFQTNKPLNAGVGASVEVEF